jgi:ABC-2 type transport system permease protein
VISYLNLAACALTLSTLTTRFVFPQFSLEGRRIWILGLAPFGLAKVLQQKFWSAFLATGFITGGVMAASCAILHFPLWKTAMFLGAIVLMSGALSGLSVGLGALFPNFREDNPSKIVSGFGGTLCLVGSFIYVTLFVTLAALPEMRRVAAGAWLVPDAVCYAAAAALSLAVLLGPLLLAAVRVKRLEI